jgi:uncharacterized membrane protein
VNKTEFLASLRDRLEIFPENEAKEYLSYYREMIEDHIDDGFPEEKVIETLGSPDDAFAAILQEIGITEILKRRVKPKRKLKMWERVLLICGSPVWVPLAIALAATAFALIVSLYVILWCLIVTLWALEISLTAAALGATFAGVLQLLLNTNGYVAGTLFACTLISAGLALILFSPCIHATKGMARLSAKIWLGIKFLIIGKEKRT